MKITVTVTRVSSYDLDVDAATCEALADGDLSALADRDADDVETIAHGVSNESGSVGTLA